MIHVQNQLLLHDVVIWAAVVKIHSLEAKVLFMAYYFCFDPGALARLARVYLDHRVYLPLL